MNQNRGVATPVANSASVAADAQFALLLAEAPVTTDHADAAEIERLQVALGCYRAATLHWAERRSAGQPSLQAMAKRNERWAALPRWSLATVALVTILGGAARLAQYGAATSTAPGSETTTAVAERTAAPADIAADNRLLSSINAELSYHAASPVDGLGLQETQQTPSQAAEDGVTE